LTVAEFTAKDVQALRQKTGAGMMDAKKALQENGGDAEAAAKWLREKGLSSAAKRSDRANEQGAVALGGDSEVMAIAEIKCETDFVAKSEQFTDLVQDLADLVAAKGEEEAKADVADRVDDLKVVLKENIEVGQIVRFEKGSGHLIDSYLHIQEGRGVNAVLVELSGGSQELAHDLALHIAFKRPPYLSRDQVPESEIAEERSLLEAETRNEGKPEQAIEKIVEGKLQGRFFADRVLLDQKFVRDESQTITALLGDAEVVRFAQVVIGA
jgi:elongation factor Ts